MKADKVKLWFDPEGDYLEVIFSHAPGYMRETKSDAAFKVWRQTRGITSACGDAPGIVKSKMQQR